ncbi:G1 family glutamic endopeptidase [Phaeacidiphilus oryzae]|jgi:hypothetical protein|uniref:G1 family glutamic endopeptidase n=1 Tax=Phaeacidiphilus oryzae TaxID=348818 RepID=UPI00068A0F3C|nr:G1 family glutamic endopeptidase [Phaeacidiphilus oryzae]
MRIRPSAASALLLAAALVPCAAGTAGASALATSVATFGPATTAHGSSGIHPDDSNWGGYVAQGSFSSISGSWTEPQVTCNSSNDLFAPWVGLDGYGSGSVEQTGVQTDCSSGRPVLSAWYEMYPASPVYWNDPVSEGDSMTASVVSDGGGNYSLTLTDNTQGWTEKTDQSYAGQNASAEAVIESPTSSYPSFGSLSFSGVTVDGRPFSDAGPSALDSGGYVPGPLSGGDFTISPGGAAVGAHSGGAGQTARQNIRY